MITIPFPSLLIRISRAYHSSISDEELYDCTRSKWKINPERANKALYAFSVYKGEILEVYEIASWKPATSLPVLPGYQKGTKAMLKSGLPNRYEFEGKPAPEAIRKHYLGKSVSHFFKKGAVNPITYLNSE